MIKYYQKRILIIDDNIEIHDDIQRVLNPKEDSKAIASATKAILFDEPTEYITTNAKFIIDSAYQGDEALKMMHESIKSFQPYALAFVDIRMPPGLDGIKTIKKIWNIDPDIQIVICTAYSDYSWNEMRKQLQFSDNFLILKKPFDVIEIRQLAFSLTKKWQLNQQNHVYVENLANILKIRSEELKKSEHLLLHQATHDTLTGLPNRALLLDRISQAIAVAKNNNSFIGSYFIDINNFQLVNDSDGFQIGDLLLKSISNRLLKFIDPSCTTLARWEGDTFVIILGKQNNENDFIKFAIELLEVIKKTHIFENKEITITASIGIGIYPIHAEDENILLKNTCAALNVAKKQGHNNYLIFNKEFHRKALKRINIKNMLYHAIEKNEFKFQYRPVCDLITQKILNIETTFHWDSKEKRIIPKEIFIPIAAETGLELSILLLLQRI